MPSITFYPSQGPYYNRWQKLEFFENNELYTYNNWNIKCNVDLGVIESSFLDQVFDQDNGLKADKYIVDFLGTPEIDKYGENAPGVKNLMFKYVHSVMPNNFKNEVWLNFHFSLHEQNAYCPKSHRFDKKLAELNDLFAKFSKDVAEVVAVLDNLNYKTYGEGAYQDWNVNTSKAKQWYPDFVEYLKVIPDNYNRPILENFAPPAQDILDDLNQPSVASDNQMNLNNAKEPEGEKEIDSWEELYEESPGTSSVNTQSTSPLVQLYKQSKSPVTSSSSKVTNEPIDKEELEKVASSLNDMNFN